MVFPHGHQSKRIKVTDTLSYAVILSNLGASNMSDFGKLFDEAVTVESMLAAMERAGRVDKRIAIHLNRLISHASRQEQFWSNAPLSQTNFTLYHSWRNLRLIFSKMLVRFSQAPRLHDNPVVVEQARAIFPRILTSMATLVSMESDPTQTNPHGVMNYIRDLRSSARSVKMIDPKDELKNVDRSKLIAAFDELLQPMATSD